MQVLVGGGLDVVHHVWPVLGILTEPLVELAAETTGDVRDDPVERLAAVLVEVQIVVDERAQQTSGLRAAIRVHVPENVRRGVSFACRPVFEPGGAVAQRGDAEPHDRRADRRIGHLVQAPLLEPALEPDVACVGDDRAAGDAGKAPAVALDRGRVSIGLVADLQHRGALVEIGGRIGAMTTIREQEVRGRPRRLKLGVDAPGDAIAARVERFRSAQAEQPGHLGQIDLPAARDHREAASHQEAVAWIDRRIRIGAGNERRTGRAVEVRDRDRVAPVDHVEHDAAARAPAIDRHQDRHVGFELDASRMVPRSQRDVGDALVRRVLGIDREPKRSFQLLVGTGVAERRTAGQWTPKSHVEPGHGHQALSTRRGRRLEIEPRSTASASSSISVGSALRITTRAPARLATGTTPAIGIDRQLRTDGEHQVAARRPRAARAYRSSCTSP